MNSSITNSLSAQSGWSFITRIFRFLNITGISKDFSNTLAGDFTPRRISAVNRNGKLKSNVGDYIVLGGFPGR